MIVIIWKIFDADLTEECQMLRWIKEKKKNTKYQQQQQNVCGAPVKQFNL